MAQQPLVGQGLLIIQDSGSHSDTPHSVGLLSTSGQPDTETSTWQHTPVTTVFHATGGIRTHNPSKRAATGIGIEEVYLLIYLRDLKELIIYMYIYNLL